MTTKRSFSDIPGARETLQLVVDALKPSYEFPSGITTPWTLIIQGSGDLELEGRLAQPEEMHRDIPRQLRESPYLIVTARTGTIDGASPDERNPVIYATTDRVVMDMRNDPVSPRNFRELTMGRRVPYQWTLEVRYT